MAGKQRKKRKSKRSGVPRKGTYKTATLPKGYEPISGFAPSWDFQQEPLLEGVVVSFGEVASKFKKGEMQRNCIIETKDGEQLTVWESATLTSLFDDFAEGESVAIAFTGYGPITKAGRKPAKLFSIGYK